MWLCRNYNTFARKSIDVNVQQADNGSTPLHWAVQNDNEEAVNFLLEKGAKIDAIDNEGNTPLYIAAQNGNEKVVELLITKGADVNVQTIKNKATPLLISSYKDHEKVVELLVKGGANPNITDTHDFTPLHFALDNKNRKVIDLLLDNGAGVKCEGNSVILDYIDKSGEECLRVMTDIKFPGKSFAGYALRPSISVSAPSASQVANAKQKI